MIRVAVPPARFQRPVDTGRPSVFLLKYWDAGDTETQNYRVDTLADAGIELHYSDAVHRMPWTTPWVRRLVRRAERVGMPFLQTVLATRQIARSDAVVAVFESQGNFLATLRAAGVWPYTRSRYAVVSCWLAMDAPRFGRGRRRWYRWAYRGVDHVFYFSRNQTEVYRDLLGVPEDRLVFVPFGIDHQYFSPRAVDEGRYILAVGRDKGRDWATLFDAVRDTDLDVRVACRTEDIAGLSVPPNVTVLGYVDRATYRDLTARARVVAVSTHLLAYPTGQSVTLESMGMGKCCVVTDTPAMSDYVRDGIDALLVPPHDSRSLRATLERAVSDADLRRRVGAAARDAVEARFTARAMWHAIGDTLVGEVRGSAGSA